MCSTIPLNKESMLEAIKKCSYTNDIVFRYYHHTSSSSFSFSIRNIAKDYCDYKLYGGSPLSLNPIFELFYHDLNNKFKSFPTTAMERNHFKNTKLVDFIEKFMNEINQPFKNLTLYEPYDIDLLNSNMTTSFFHRPTNIDSLNFCLLFDVLFSTFDDLIFCTKSTLTTHKRMNYIAKLLNMHISDLTYPSIFNSLNSSRNTSTLYRSKKLEEEYIQIQEILSILSSYENSNNSTLMHAFFYLYELNYYYHTIEALAHSELKYDESLSEPPLPNQFFFTNIFFTSKGIDSTFTKKINNIFWQWKRHFFRIFMNQDIKNIPSILSILFNLYLDTKKHTCLPLDLNRFILGATKIFPNNIPPSRDGIPNKILKKYYGILLNLYNKKYNPISISLTNALDAKIHPNFNPFKKVTSREIEALPTSKPITMPLEELVEKLTKRGNYYSLGCVLKYYSLLDADDVFIQSLTSLLTPLLECIIKDETTAPNNSENIKFPFQVNSSLDKTLFSSLTYAEQKIFFTKHCNFSCKNIEDVLTKESTQTQCLYSIFHSDCDKQKQKQCFKDFMLQLMEHNIILFSNKGRKSLNKSSASFKFKKVKLP